MSQGKKYLASKQLSIDMLHTCPEIIDWLSQFPADKQIVARSLLLHLEFISRDQYSDWLQKTINNLSSEDAYALYSVRKLDNTNPAVWDKQGKIVMRPGVSQGSEDFVYSLISNLVRADHQEKLLDHPSLDELRDKKIHNIVLVDDSIGSGDRVTKFINAMLGHPTFLSWWSFGWIKIHVVAFARQREAEKQIITCIRGSNHWKRKYKKSSKITFTGEKVYSLDHLESRWGNKYQDIISLCNDRTVVAKKYRKGYGDVMANLVFYHSVPNNIPGVVWFQNNKWQALLPYRTFPDWLLALFDSQTDNKNIGTATSISNEMIHVLKLMKRGIRNTASIALRLNCDNSYATALVDKAIVSGFITAKHRLSKTGFDLLKSTQATPPVPFIDHSLYIPSSWCAGRVNIQPHVPSTNITSSEDMGDHADSDQNGFCEDGEVGQASLEKTDAKAAPPPFSIMLNKPVKTRNYHDTNGPEGSKDR